MLEEEILNILNNSSLIIAQAQILVDLLNSDISKYKKVYILAKLRKLEKQSNGLFRIPILKRQYFKFKLMKDTRAIIELEDNIWKSWKLTKKEKREILKRIRGE